VIKGKQRLYCILDTEEDRWFRLPEGRIDKRAQVALVGSREDGQPGLLDLQTGTFYRMKPGHHSMTADPSGGPGGGH
jgi:hypothetical protein